MKWYCKNGVWSDGAGAPVKVAPLQLNYHDKTVPWEVAAEGYKEYSAQYGTRQSLPRLCERGGFSATELCILLFERIKRIEQPAPETEVLPSLSEHHCESECVRNGEPSIECPKHGLDPTKLAYDEWVDRTRECPSCHGQGCEPHEASDGRLVQGAACNKCDGAGRIPL